MKMASEQKETIFRLEYQRKMVGYGQGTRIGNFGADGVRTKGHTFIWKIKTRNGRFWAGSGLGALVKIASGQEETIFNLGDQMKMVGF